MTLPYDLRRRFGPRAAQRKNTLLVKIIKVPLERLSLLLKLSSVVDLSIFKRHRFSYSRDK